MSPPARPEEVADRLHSASIHLLRRVRREDEVLDLTPARLSALSVLVFGGPMTVGQLAAAEQVRSPTMSRLLSDLEARGLVTRTTPATDRRVAEIRATPRGRWTLQAGQRRRVATLASHLTALEPADLEVLDRAAELLEEIVAGWRGP
jgi:DNA-binding MarR family transcriptional regulator